MQAEHWSARMAQTMMQRHPQLATKWAYEWGVVLSGILGVWRATQAPEYFDYIKKNIDYFVDEAGLIQTYRQHEYNLDHLHTGKLLFPLWEASDADHYRQALCLLRDQLKTHPRTSEGGFWHKHIYPHQMWLDGAYMASPFLAQFAVCFEEPTLFDEVAHQLTLLAQHTRDPHTGLLYHGWDESKGQKWSDAHTGCSPHFWGRAMGWYVMALVDVLDFFPATHPSYTSIKAILATTFAALLPYQDPQTGLWYQVLDQGERAGNYLEASAACMFVYALAKGIRKGYLPADYLAAAQRTYEGILKTFITVDAQGLVTVNGICGVAGLGGNPYRDASFEYYTNEPIVPNDYKGVGAFILASLEMERVIP